MSYVPSTSAVSTWRCQCGVDVPLGWAHTCAHIGPTPGREITVNPPWPTELLAAKDAEIARLSALVAALSTTPEEPE